MVTVDTPCRGCVPFHSSRYKPTPPVRRAMSAARRCCPRLDPVATIPSLFVTNLAVDPTLPMITWYAPEERTELSGATFGNWVFKTANLLVDGQGLGSGDTARVELPSHWQTAAVMLGCWTAGLAIAHSNSVTTDISFGVPGTDCDFVVGLHPLGLPVQPGDWVSSARAFGDHYGGPPAPEDALALAGLPTPVTHADLAARAVSRAGELGITRGDRALINVDSHPRPLDWLVAPLAVGASLVLCRGLDGDAIARIAATERATVT